VQHKETEVNYRATGHQAEGKKAKKINNTSKFSGLTPRILNFEQD
jgi:hypothetical protein